MPEEKDIQEELKHKGRGKARTYKEYLTGMTFYTIDNGGWIVNLNKGRIKRTRQVLRVKVRNNII